jgi:Zn-dependent protease with chaperone function
VAFSSGDRGLAILTGGVLIIGLVAGLPMSAAPNDARLDGYAEWRRSGLIIVDGQRVGADQTTRWTGEPKSLAEVPLGHEVRVRGARQLDGSVLAREIDVRPNRIALFEDEVQQGTNELEGLWLRSGEAFEVDRTGRRTVIGEVAREGRSVDRVRRLVRRMSPSYLDHSKIRVYVVDNKEWNAMAMGNGAVWVFSGIMNDMTDDELAVVVGHELAHYTHEHSRRQMRKNMWIQFGSVAALLAAGAIDNSGWRAAAELGSALGFSAWMSGYGRNLEDQADRVGLRYAHEGGFDVNGAPQVWQRFLTKYGEGDRVTNFFFSDHSRASARRKNLELELRNNYTSLTSGGS